MSLIENALQKLRRAGEMEAAARSSATEQAARAANGEVPLKVAAPAAVVPEQRPTPSVPRRRIAIDLKALRERGYLPEQELERRFADHYRQIKRPLIEKALAGPAEMRLIVVTSALPGDGKTFTSINLALSIARERDVSVLLVDADAPRGQVSQVFNIREEPGLLDALRDESLDVESLIQETDIRGLEILPAGPFVENATELMASARMNQLAAQISARRARQLVIFDTAPLLVSSEARIMSRIPGQIVIVARAGATPRQAITDSLAHVDRSRVQGIILNQAGLASGAAYYEYPGYGGDRHDYGEV